VQFDHPRRVCLGQDVSFRPNVGQLVLLELQTVRGEKLEQERAITISDFIRDLRA
jgi:hypothetical protein